MRKVLIFKETLLPPSETFVLEQARTLSDYVPVFAGLERVQPSLVLPHEPLLLSDYGQSIAGARAKLYRRTGVAPRFHFRTERLGAVLIHAHFASGGRTALSLARRLRVPLVVTLHGSDITVQGAKAGRYRRLGENASLFVCVSDFIRGRAIAAGLPPEKLIVHYIGVDRDLFSASNTCDRSRDILFVGRLVEKKGCQYLLRAMRIVQQRHPECGLNVIGEGPLRPLLEQLAQELGTQCRFLGNQPSVSVRKALAQARILCMPSVTAANGDCEGLPTVLAEAMSMGVPVVSTTHAGIPEIVVNQVTGLLTPESDHEAIAAALCDLLENEERWRQFRSAALKRIELYFDLKRQTAALEKIYDRVLARDCS